MANRYSLFLLVFLVSCAGGGLTGNAPGSGINAAAPLDAQLPNPAFDPEVEAKFSLALTERKLVQETSISPSSGNVILDPKTQILGQVRENQKINRLNLPVQPCCEGQWVSIAVISPFTSRVTCNFFQIGTGGNLDATFPASEFSELVIVMARSGFEPPADKTAVECNTADPLGNGQIGELLALLEGKPAPAPTNQSEALTFVPNTANNNANQVVEGIVPIAPRPEDGIVSPLNDSQPITLDGSAGFNSLLSTQNLQLLLGGTKTTTNSSSSGSDEDSDPLPVVK